MKLYPLMKHIMFASLLALTGMATELTEVHADMKPVYDLSEYQQNINESTARMLKNETSFVILKAQNGSAREDPVFANNANNLMQAGVPFGAYSYSTYTNTHDAINQAKMLYQRAPQARFYVNDCEENDIKSGNINNATIAWANTIKKLTNKPVVLYSGLWFLNNNLMGAKDSYSAIWLADYTRAEPNPSYQYDLWQYTDHASSTALGQKVDASVIPTGGKPLSFWIGNQSSNQGSQPKVVHMNKNESSGRSYTYYTNTNIKTLTVISKNGLPIFSSNHQYLLTKPKGTVIRIKRIYYHNGAYVAVTENNNLCVTDKALVSAK